MKKLTKRAIDVVKGVYSLAVGIRTLLRYVEIRVRK